jgi:hypothetical protein
MPSKYSYAGDSCPQVSLRRVVRGLRRVWDPAGNQLLPAVDSHLRSETPSTFHVPVSFVAKLIKGLYRIWKPAELAIAAM